MEKKSKKSVVIGITVLFLVILILLGLTYAYYRTRIVGNEEEKSISVTSKKLEVTYSDDKAVIEAEGIEPGYTATKTFTVENTGSEPTNFGIVLDNVENTFTRKSDWTFVLKQGNIVIKEGIVPSQTSYILNTKSIAADETIEYTLTITYANLKDVNQSDDMGSTLSLRVNIDNETGTILESATEGTLLAAIRDDNLISEPLTPAGKAPSGIVYVEDKEYIETVTASVTEDIQDYYIIYGTGYEFDAASGVYNLTGVQIKKYSEIYNNLGGKYIIGSDEFEALTETYPNETYIENSTIDVPMLFTVLSDPAPTLTSFSVGVKEYTELQIKEDELSQTEDNYGTSYYYRGLVENNYVNFSGMCFRIVRVQGDGKIKLILADDEYLCNDENFGTDMTRAYVGNGANYKYDSSSTLEGMLPFDYSNSDIKKILDVWLNGGTATLNDTTTNVTFENKIDVTKLVETDWCNDLSQSFINDSTIEFGGYGRLYYNRKIDINPSLKCDFIGLNNTESNVISNLKIGILNGDEIAFSGLSGAGVSLSTAYRTKWKNFITENGYNFWTMTPYHYFNLTQTIHAQFYVGRNSLSNASISNSYKIRPVIVLPANTSITSGNGTKLSPYVVS